MHPGAAARVVREGVERLAILPDGAAWWVGSPGENPLFEVYE